jgi:predicted O-linked N-acetylglucosamine transferase (SPINDLY family)
VFLLPLLERLDRSRFEVVCYSTNAQHDHVTARIQGLADRWRDAQGWTDPQLAAAVHEDGIDVLVDLLGHCQPSRLPAFCERPAPLQVSWLGYLQTTGLTRMDYRLCDQRTDPEHLSAPLHTETLARLPHSQWCYRPFVDVPAAAVAPVERNGFITFGSFNSPAKVSDEMCARWGRILRSVPGSRLLLVGVSSQRKRDAMLAALLAAGIDAGRIRFAPRVDLHAYFGLYADVDIALDPYPYGGGTTTFDTLWMGVPLLAASGPYPVSRSAASILCGLDLADWVAPDIASYEDVAVARASDVSGIVQLRRTLRQRLAASAFMDEASYAAAFQSTLLQLWSEHLSKP